MSVLGVAIRIRDAVEALEAALHRRARRIVGVRILDKLGWTNFLRAVAVGVWLISLAQVISSFRSDLIHPADIGTDSSNYLAAAQRLVAGHRIYALETGDRPVPLDNAPEWTVPILSPPTAAASYLPETVLPDAVAVYPAWLVGLAGTIAAALLAILLAPPLLVLLAIQLLPGLAVTAWSGNVNALIGPTIVVAWLAGRSEKRSVQVAAGVVVALATCIKIGPLFLGWWLVVRRRWWAVGAMVVAAVLVLVVAIAGAGIQSFTDYLSVVAQASSNPSPLSVQGALRNLGLPPALATLGLGVFLVAIATATWLLDWRPEAFLLAVIGTVFATAVVRLDSIGLVVIAGIAWAGHGLFIRRGRMKAVNGPIRRQSIASGAIAGVLAVTALWWSVATGGLDRSSLSISNQTSEMMVVRMTVIGQEASFGYAVPPGTTVTAWQELGGGSPPLLTVWTQVCDLRGQVQLPRRGGLVIVGADKVVLDGQLSVGGQVAAYVSDCAPEFKAAHIRP